MKTATQIFTTGVKEITTEPAFYDDVVELDGKYYKVGGKRLEVRNTKGKAIHMEKRLFLILSVSIMLFAGCGNKGITTDREAEKTETAGGTEETDMAGMKPAAVQTEDGGTEKAQAETEAPEETEPEEEDREEVETPAPQPVSQPEPKGETESAQGSTDVPEPGEMKPEAKPEERGTECEAEPEEAEPEGTEQQEQMGLSKPPNI